MKSVLLSLHKHARYSLLPTSDLVVYSERHALLEFGVVVVCISRDHACSLESKRDVKVLRHVALGPVCYVAVTIWIIDANGLNRLPSEEGVMADEWRYLAVSNIEVDL